VESTETGDWYKIQERWPAFSIKNYVGIEKVEVEVSGVGGLESVIIGDG
jgi:hypothetical protein